MRRARTFNPVIHALVQISMEDGAIPPRREKQIFQYCTVSVPMIIRIKSYNKIQPILETMFPTVTLFPESGLFPAMFWKHIGNRRKHRSCQGVDVVTP